MNPSSGNVGVFLQLFEVNYSKVKNLAYSLLKSELDAEDVAQEVFTKTLGAAKYGLIIKGNLMPILIMTKKYSSEYI